jgi:PAS domain S-box-containing protein
MKQTGQNTYNASNPLRGLTYRITINISVDCTLIMSSSNNPSIDDYESYIKFIKSLNDGFELLETLQDKDGNIIDYVFVNVNPAYERQSGLKASNLVGKCKKEVAPASEQCWYDYAAKAVKTGRIQSYLYFNPNVNCYYETQFIPIPPKKLAVLFKDITERKKNEEALKESEERYRMLFSSIDEAFALHEMIFDSQGVPSDYRFLEVNGAFERQTGLKANEIIGKTVCEILPDLEPIWIETYGKVVLTGEQVKFENYSRSLKKYFEVFAFRPFQGKFAAIFVDISERKKTEQRLKEKDDELSRILDSTPTIIFYKDKQGKVIQANKAFADALKVKREDLLGKTVFDLYSPEIAQKMTNDDLEVMKSKKPKTGTIEPYESPTGLRWIRTDKIPIIDDNGEVNGIIGFSEEITERKKDQEALERQAALIDLSPDAILVRAINDGTIIFWSKGAEELYGWTKDEALGKRSHDLLQTVFPIPLAEIISKVKTNKRWSGELIHKTKGGRNIEVQSRWLLESSITGKPENILETNVDLTDLRKAEAELRNKERLAAIGTTAGMVGHDIRNPLQAIIGDLYIAKEESKDMPESVEKKAMQETIYSIEENIFYINKIVVDLQDYARPVSAQYSTVNVSNVLVKTFENVRIPESIKLSIKVNDLEKVWTDPTLLQRTLSNLVTNAIQAMPEGGNLEVTAHPQKDKAVITVSDTGIGIPEEIKPKLFSPMTTTKAKGQGFGLAVSKRLIEAMKGTISFESQEGKGTKFIIELPINKQVRVRHNTE